MYVYVYYKVIAVSLQPSPEVASPREVNGHHQTRQQNRHHDSDEEAPADAPVPRALHRHFLHTQQHTQLHVNQCVIGVNWLTDSL